MTPHQPPTSPHYTASLRGGAVHLSAQWTATERRLYSELSSLLEAYGYLELSVPSLISRSTIERQGVVTWEQVLKVDDQWALAGSAEQGILERYADQVTGPVRLYAVNQCFRNEPRLEGFKWLREFRKLELYGFGVTDDQALGQYEEARSTVRAFMSRLGVNTRWVAVTTRDPGYHLIKWDLEVETRAYGWLETHSMAYYGTEQTARFGIGGARYSWCATGLATPRALVPLLERDGFRMEDL